MSSSWRRYESNPSFILGFHGCDKRVGEALISGQISDLAPSKNKWDWLGHGRYFWESSPERAMEFATESATGTQKGATGKIKFPFVVGAIIDPKHCLNLMDRSALVEVINAHNILKKQFRAAKAVLPKNAGGLRILDCAVFEALHQSRMDNDLEPYDIVRGIFIEGKPLYSGTKFLAKDHIQICVRSEACILGYFKPIED